MPPKKTTGVDLPIHGFPSAVDFESFLAENYDTLPGFHLKLAKKSSGIQSITAAEAVEVALCFGWIDGRANSFDDQYWLVRYTPRRAKSIWSQKNVETVSRLIAEQRMRPAGLAAVEAAKADGRWDKAYAGQANMAMPDDMKEALAAEPAAQTFWNGLSKSQKYGVLFKLANISAVNRADRVQAYVQILATERVPGIVKQPVTKPRSLGATKEGTTRRVSRRTVKGK